MKNQLCKPCDYRRAFRLRFNFQRNPGFTAIGMYEYGRLLQSFNRHWTVRPPRSKPCEPSNSVFTFIKLQILRTVIGVKIVRFYRWYPRHYYRMFSRFTEG